MFKGTVIFLILALQNKTNTVKNWKSKESNKCINETIGIQCLKE